MPRRLQRDYGRSDLHFITFSCYRHLPALADPGHRTVFVRALEKLRPRYGFSLVGCVVMPEHIHLLLSAPKLKTPSTVIQVLQQTVSRQVLQSLRSARPGSPPHRLLAPLTVSSPSARAHLWQRRFYDLNVWSEKKKWEKLESMHLNPVKRGLVKHPGHWPWSSFRFYAQGDTTMLAMDLWPPPLRRA